MLTIADFRRAIDNAPELGYIDESWTKRDNYRLLEGERGAYVCAPMFMSARVPGVAEPVYSANLARDGGPEEEFLETLQEHFVWRSYCLPFSGTAEEEKKSFVRGFFRKPYEAIDEAGEARLRRWLEEEHRELGDEAIGLLLDLSAETRAEVDESIREWLYQLRGEANESFRVGGQERMREFLRERLYPEVREQDLEDLFEVVGKDLQAGANLEEALDRVVPIDEYGAITHNAFTKNIVFNMVQDALKKFEGRLDKLMEQQKNTPRSFYPLSLPGLFLEFAELGGQKISQEDVLEWANRYGVLGLGLEEYAGDVKPLWYLGGPRESVAAFTQEAQEANFIKRVYEAALRLDSDEDEVVVAAVRELHELFGWSEYSSLSVPECSEKAWNVVTMQVQTYLDHHCVVRWRRAGNGLVEFLQFKSLLGAMYLQLAWVLRDRADVRRCKNCGKPVGRRKNKQFCNRGCKDTFRNQLNRERGDEESLSFSMPSATREEVEALAAARGVGVDALFQDMLQVYKGHSRAR